MSSEEALDLDGRARIRKQGSVWETRIKANQEKIRSSRTTMSNTEIQVDKKVGSTTPKQSPTAKNKAVGISRQRSDLVGGKKPPLQIKRSRSAAAATTVRDDINLVKLRKIKSDSAKNIDGKLENLLPLESVEVDQQATKSDDETVVKTITNNADADCIEEDEDQQVEVQKTSLEIKDLTITFEEEKPKKLVIVEKTAPATRIHPTPISDHHHRASSKLQSLADLIMWRDVSRSAFVFGIGSFAIISSSYTKDLNISCISVLSYLGLIYLAVSFTFRSLITRENIDMDSTDEEYVVGEEEAVWVMKLVLPYLNEFLSKLRSLFSGDPATTMKDFLEYSCYQNSVPPTRLS
ncbi:Reticulon family protein [Perilla frutescens var. hirtella]|uniref:Reticulon-like protein n=1 Tax=Perilla frutescens var. hirtella TaxID=608512 RepID=A0AAD4P6D7_PERFH|nr:Reticulon family protein [Perilla frutescens var. hirtella]